MMTTVVISPEGTVRVEISGTGLFQSEQDFLSAVETRPSQIMQTMLGARALVK